MLDALPNVRRERALALPTHRLVEVGGSCQATHTQLARGQHAADSEGYSVGATWHTEYKL